MPRRFEETRFFILNDYSMRVSPALAVEIGFNESIIYLQLEFLIAIRGEWIDARKWVRMSLTDLEVEFPFWSSATINRAIKNLERDAQERSLLFVENYNQHSYDKTRWFAINVEAATTLSSLVVKPVGEPVSRDPRARFDAETRAAAVSKNGTGHETDPFQNERGSSHFERGSFQNERAKSNKNGGVPFQNETTIHREYLENKERENTHTRESADELALFHAAGVCVSNNLTFENYRDYARSNPSFTNPDAWALKTYANRTSASDALVREWLTTNDPETVAARLADVRASIPDNKLFFHEAAQRVTTLTSDGTDPLVVIDDLPIDADVRARLIERFCPATESSEVGSKL